MHDGGDLVNDFERTNLFDQNGVNSALDAAGIFSGEDFHVDLSRRQWSWTSNNFFGFPLTAKKSMRESRIMNELAKYLFYLSKCSKRNLLCPKQLNLLL